MGYGGIEYDCKPIWYTYIYIYTYVYIYLYTYKWGEDIYGR